MQVNTLKQLPLSESVIQKNPTDQSFKSFRFSLLKQHERVQKLNHIQSITELQGIQSIRDDLQANSIVYCRPVGKKHNDFILAYMIAYLERVLLHDKSSYILRRIFESFQKKKRPHLAIRKRESEMREKHRLTLRGHLFDLCQRIDALKKNESFTIFEKKRESLIYFYQMIQYSPQFLESLCIVIRHIVNYFLNNRHDFRIQDTGIPAFMVRSLRQISIVPIPEEAQKYSVKDNYESVKQYATFIATTNSEAQFEPLPRYIMALILGHQTTLFSADQLFSTVDPFEKGNNVGIIKKIDFFREETKFAFLELNGIHYILYPEQVNILLLNQTMLHCIRSRSENNTINHQIQEEKKQEERKRNNSQDLINLNCGCKENRQLLLNQLNQLFPLVAGLPFQARFFNARNGKPKCINGDVISFNSLNQLYGNKLRRKEFQDQKKIFERAQEQIVDIPPRDGEVMPDRRSRCREIIAWVLVGIFGVCATVFLILFII